MAAEPGQLRTLRDGVRSALEELNLPAGLLDRIVLAVGEACMNIVQHGYPSEARGTIGLALWREGHALIVELTDDAARVDPEHLRGRALEDIRPGGLGLHFIHEIMDSVQYLEPVSGNGLKTSETTGNRLRMVKNLDPDAAGQ
ncbi:MAG: ATP-binding protein [Gammaproteobacteria bacterium]